MRLWSFSAFPSLYQWIPWPTAVEEARHQEKQLLRSLRSHQDDNDVSIQ